MIPEEVLALFREFEATIHNHSLSLSQAVERMEELDQQANQWGYTFTCDIENDTRSIEPLPNYLGKATEA